MNLVLQDAERSGIKASLRRPGCGSDRRRLILWSARNEQEQRISLRRERNGPCRLRASIPRKEGSEATGEIPQCMSERRRTEVICSPGRQRRAGEQITGGRRTERN